MHLDSVAPAPALLHVPAEPGSWLARLQPRRVAVFRALQLGDMLCAVPALRALRAALPNASVTLVGLPWARDFAARFKAYVDDFLCFPGYPGLPERALDATAWPGFLGQAQARRFELAIQMHGDGSRTNALVELLGARHCAGFAPGEQPGPFLPYPQRGPEPERLLSLARFLGAPADDARLEFPLEPQDQAHWDGHEAVQALQPGRYVCLHPGARAAERRWPARCFAALADTLAEESGLSVVFTGSAEESGLVQSIMATMRTPAVDAAAAVPAGALAALIARSRLLVGNDTGTSHIAAALRVPSVIVFRASDPQRWAPIDRARHRVVWDPPGTALAEVLREARALLGLRPLQ